MIQFHPSVSRDRIGCAEEIYSSETEFGRAILEAHFPHMASKGVAMLNSGSFGIAPISVIERKMQYIRDFESYGDLFVRQHQLESFMASVNAVADLLNLRESQCTLIDNVTTGVSNLIDQFAHPSDVILVNSWTYGSVKSAAKLVGANMAEHHQRRLVEVGIQLPLESAAQFVDKVRKTLDENPEIRIAIFDYITSSTACVMPVRPLAELCRARGILVIIDGAHAIGQIRDLDIPSIGADFFVGNLHKWLFAPKSSALLWARSQELAQQLRPSVVSWLATEPEMPLRFAFLGTRDISSLCAVSEAVAFARNVCGGVPRIHSYCTSLADEASQHLVERWGSHLLPIPQGMQAPYMRLIALPKHLQDPRILEMTKESKMYSPMWSFVLNKLKINSLFINIEGILYIRISYAVIVCMEDIRRLGETVMQLTTVDFLG